MRSRRPPADPIESPVADLMREEFEAKPFRGFGGIVGEWQPPRPVEPAGVNYEPPLEIPAPNWEQEEAEAAERERAQREAEARKVLGLPDDEPEQPDYPHADSAEEPAVEAEPPPPERPEIPPPDWSVEPEPSGQRGKRNRRRYRRARRRLKGAE